MKNKLLLLIALSILTIHTGAFAQDTTIVHKTISYIDTSSNFRQIYGDFIGGLSVMAKALKVSAGHVYEVLIRQQRINAISHIIVFIIFMVLPFLYYKRLSKMVSEDKITYIVAGVLTVFPLVIGGCYLLANIHDITMELFNPEYGAIKDIVRMVNQFRDYGTGD